MANKRDLQRWWDGLDEGQRARALRAHKAGRATGDLKKSLRDAGLDKDGDDDDTSIPDDVDVFLKARH